MSLVLLGLGTALPPTRIDQAEAVQVAQAVSGREPEKAHMLPLLYRFSGIQTRHLVLPPDVVRDVLDGTRKSGSEFLPTGADDPGPTTAVRMTHYRQLAPPLARDAAAIALEHSGRDVRDVTHLVTVSCTGFHAPGVDRYLIEELGLHREVERTHVGFMGCHGAINGLRVASAFAVADPSAVVLLCAVELCSLHYHYGWHPQKMVANALFADGAAAAVGAGVGDGWRVAASGSCLFPDSADAMSWNIGDNGFTMTLSARVPELVRRNLRPWLERWLARHGLTVEQIASWAIHPGGPRVLASVEEALGLERTATTASREVLAEYGNMSSPTVLFILDRLQRREAPRPCVTIGFGPGLVAEAALFV